MQRNNIDLGKRFREEICSFEMSKKVKEAGMTCANTFFAYDKGGEMTDGGWLQKMGYEDFYPAVNFCLAVFMLDDAAEDTNKMEAYEYAGNYFFRYKDELFQSDNIVDAILKVWLYATKKKKQ